LGLLYPELETLLEVMKRPKRDKFQPQVLSTQEVILLLQVTENLKHRFALGMLYSCGLRIGELLNMRLFHIDLDRQQVFVKHGKGRKDRHVSIAVSMFPLIKNYLATYRPETYVLESLSGGPYSSSSIRSFLRRSCKKAGIIKKITPHSLRHSYATHMIENGVGLRHVQELLGHSKPETTMLYTHIARKDLLQIVNPLDAAVKTFKSTKEPPNISLSGDF
jgi:integrase/recombinase XerD